MDAFYHSLRAIGYTHPVHPTMVYLPIGCVMAATIFALLAAVFRKQSLSVSARHCIVLAFFAAFPAIFFGYMDWQHLRGGSWVFAIQMKIVLVSILVVLLFIALVRQWRTRAERKSFLGLYFLCFLTVVGIGYFGGELVFGHRHDDGHALAERQKSGTSGPEEETPLNYADVSPIFEQHCLMCHKGPRAPHGLRLDTYGQLMEGSDNRLVIVPGKPQESELLLRLTGGKKPSMPYMQDPLAPSTIETVRRWIAQGAKGPDKGQAQQRNSSNH